MVPLLLSCAWKQPTAPASVELATLTEDQLIEGFRVEAIYVDGEDDVVGARLRHEHTRMLLRLLYRDTVPQSYLWVETVPDSDLGEPHTQEHLLLGKGNKGRAVATLEEMSMVNSSAFTDQHQTVYHFRTTAGPDVFFDVFDARLDAMLNPDYLDEEIRREVHHWGVAEGSDGLALEENGTVYNEMDSSYQQPGRVLWRTMPKDLYGAGHPQTFESGGHPDALRELGPDRIRAFHTATHQLPNMGAIVFLPETVPLVTALDRFDDTFVRLQPEPTPADLDFVSEADLPPPNPVADRTVRELRYPHGEASGDATVMLAFPPERDLSLLDEHMLTLLMSAIAGAENTNLYKALVDSRTRERDVGARFVSAWASDDLGHPLYLQVGGLPSADLDDDDVSWIVGRMRRELADVAALRPGDPKLVDLHRRIDAELVSWRRQTRESMTGPPGFGTRGTGSGWYDYLAKLDEEDGFRRPLLMEPQMEALEQALSVAQDENLWTTRLADWGLLDTDPFVYVNRPSPARLADLTAAKEARVDAKLASLMAQHGTDDPKVALAAFAKAYDAATAELEAAAKAPEARFLESPPLVPDDGIDVSARELGGVPLSTARFDAMAGAKLGLMLDLTNVPEDEAVWLRVLAELLTEVGVIVDGVPISNDEVLERLQREVLYASAETETRASKGRAELALYAGGTDPTETRAAIGWVRTFLTSPDWRPENLPRIRDLIDQRLSRTRRRMLGAEEDWTDNPRRAWEHQADVLQLHIWSFLTYEHDLLRLKYRLMDPDPAAGATLAKLAAADLDRETLTAVLAGWQGRPTEVPKAARALVPVPVPAALADAGEDLERTVDRLPDETLKTDVPYLAKRLAADLAEDPARALTELDGLRTRVLLRGGARVVAAGGAMLDELDPDLEALLSVLADGEPATVERDPTPAIRARVAARGGDDEAVHVGLFDPNRRSGVAMLSAPLTSLEQIDEEHILDYLAVRTLGGGGAHSLFIRTWGAGLAYSNGSSASEFEGRMRWNAERCPTLPQTVDFVTEVVRGTPIDAGIAEYAIASVFWSRADDSYWGRAIGWANDQVDGEPPEAVRAFREAVLSHRGSPDLAEQLGGRVEQVYGLVLPGLGAPTTEVEGAVSFVIGDGAQLDDWDVWLRGAEGLRVQVIYPRDFWLVREP